MWVVKPNGEMVCFQPGGRAVTVDPPIGSSLKLLAVSRILVWGIKHNFKVLNIDQMILEYLLPLTVRHQ